MEVVPDADFRAVVTRSGWLTVYFAILSVVFSLALGWFSLQMVRRTAA